MKVLLSVFSCNPLHGPAALCCCCLGCCCCYGEGVVVDVVDVVVVLCVDMLSCRGALCDIRIY